MKATLLARIFDDNRESENALPRPFGVFYQEERYVYEEALLAQIDKAKEIKGEGDLDALLAGPNTWKID